MFSTSTSVSTWANARSRERLTASAAHEEYISLLCVEGEVDKHLNVFPRSLSNSRHTQES